jgi:hypothetical protein
MVPGVDPFILHLFAAFNRANGLLLPVGAYNEAAVTLSFRLAQNRASGNWPRPGPVAADASGAEAYFSRNALQMATRFSPFLNFYYVLLFPLGKPTAMLLDLWLGWRADLCFGFPPFPARRPFQSARK